MGRPLLIIVHANVRPFAVLHRVERVLFGINPDHDLLSRPLPSGSPQVRNPIIGIVPRYLVDAGDLNIGHGGFTRAFQEAQQPAPSAAASSLLP
jgi:hypothetical protein